MVAMIPLLGQANGDEVRLTFAGGVIMVVSICLVLGLLAFCLTRILRESHPETHHHAPLDIDTRDREE